MTALLDNIERVPAPSPEVLDRCHLRTGTPVTLVGLSDRTSLGRLQNGRIARAELGHVRLPIRPNPVTEFLHGRRRPRPRVASFARFYDELVSNVTSRDFCIEHETPAGLAARIPPPRYVAIGDARDGWTSYMFMAGAGSTTPLHYDVDLRAFVMVQVFGHKRYVIIDPVLTRKLAPAPSPGAHYVSSLLLENFSRSDLAGFLRYSNAWECVLRPGDALVVPAGAWHYVEYLDVALSISFRLPRNHYLRFLADAVPASVELQALAACFRDDGAVGESEAAAFAALEREATRDYPSPDGRLATLDALCSDLTARLGLPIATPGYHLGDIERREAATSGLQSLVSTAGGPRRRGAALVPGR